MLMSYWNYLRDPGGEWVGDIASKTGQADRLLSQRLSPTAVFPLDVSSRRRFSQTPVSVGCISILKHANCASDLTIRLLDHVADAERALVTGPYEPPEAMMPRRWVVFLPSPVAATDIEVTASDSGLPAQVSGLWAGPVWRPDDGIQREWGDDTPDLSGTDFSKAGQLFDTERDVVRELSVTLSKMSFAHTYGEPDQDRIDLQRLNYIVGSKRPVIFTPRAFSQDGSLDQHAINRLAIYGVLATRSRITHIGADRYRQSWTIKEIT